jgi:hypothetical protein
MLTRLSNTATNFFVIIATVSFELDSECCSFEHDLGRKDFLEVPFYKDAILSGKVEAGKLGSKIAAARDRIQALTLD